MNDCYFLLLKDVRKSKKCRHDIVRFFNQKKIQKLTFNYFVIINQNSFNKQQSEN